MQLLDRPARDPFIQSIHAAGKPGGKTALAWLTETLGSKLSDPVARMRTPVDRETVISAAFSGLANFDALGDRIEKQIIEKFRAGPDTTAKWTKRTTIPNFKEAEVAIVSNPARAMLLARGHEAAHVTFGITSPEGWRLARFALQFTIDEQDLVDGLQYDPLLMAVGEIGAAMKRLIPDMVYAYLLGNPTLADGVALFHTNRGNTASNGALSASSLGAAYGAIAGQTLTDLSGDPVHLNLLPGYLIVPPTKAILAKSVAREVDNGETPISVLSESRIGPTGVVDPLADDVVTGSNTLWYVAAPSDEAPSILVGTLEGQPEPKVRSGELTQGQWGRWYDVQFSVAVVALSGKGLYRNVA